MILVYSGTGMFLILFFATVVLLVNLPLYINYIPKSFELINWQIPGALSAVAAWVIAEYSEKMNREATEDTYMGRVFLYLGKKHHVFWIPVRYWTFIFIALVAWDFWRKN